MKKMTHFCTGIRSYCVRRVKAALVMEVGRFRPLVISLQIFLLITSTRPPFSVTSLYSLYRSSTCLAMIGIRFTGVPGNTNRWHWIWIFQNTIILLKVSWIEMYLVSFVRLTQFIFGRFMHHFASYILQYIIIHLMHLSANGKNSVSALYSGVA